MSTSYHEKLELQKALCSLLKQIYENPQESPARQKSIETLLLMLDHLPLKSRLSGLQKYYDKAIEVTKRDVSKNIANFPVKYNLNIMEIGDRDFEGLAEVEKCFVSWVLMILRPDCIDEHRKTKRKFNRINEDADVLDIIDAKDSAIISRTSKAKLLAGSTKNLVLISKVILLATIS